MELATQGKTDVQISEIIGICEKTLNIWKNKHPEFLQSLKEAKQAADELVEASLFRRATGYSHKAVKIFQYEGVIVTHEYEEQYPPDTAAAIFWLKNRQPKNWRDDKHLQLPGENVKRLIIEMGDGEGEGESD